MQIGMLGTGRMAQELGRLWSAAGHAVMFGSRDPLKAAHVAQQTHPSASGGSYADTAAFGEVVVLAVPWFAAQDVIAAAGSLAGKILVDMTNPLQDGQWALGFDTSAAEQIAAWASGARVVKAFNSIFYRNLDELSRGGEASAFLCGDDLGAKGTVAQLALDCGFDPVDSGPLRNARLLEPLAVLWMELASTHGTDIAFRLLRRGGQ